MSETIEPRSLPRRPDLERLYRAVLPFAKLIAQTSGRIPIERISGAQWSELFRAFDNCDVPPPAE